MQRTLQAMGLSLPGGNQHERSSLQNRSHSHRQSFERNLCDVTVEQRRIVAARRVGQPYAMGRRFQLVTRLVEPDVAVAADADKLQIDPAGSLNRSLVQGTFGVEVFGGPIQEVNLRWWQVHAGKQVVLHERPEAAGVSWPYAAEFVQVERDGAREVHLAGRMQPAQLGVRGNRAVPRRQSEDERWRPCERVGDAPRDRGRGEISGIEDVDVHALRDVRRHPRLPTRRGERKPHGSYSGLHLQKPNAAARGNFRQPRFDVANE